VWATDQFDPAQRGRVTAVFTAFFQAAIFVVPWLAGAALKAFSFGEVFLALASASVIFGAYVMIGGSEKPEP
jgi:predicted MFS family arabinose efflux permease